MNRSSVFIFIIAFSSIAFVSACSKSDDGKSEKSNISPTVSVPAPVPASTLVQKYEGKIVRQVPNNRGKDDGWYLVKGGKRQWIADGAWLGRNGFKAEDVIEINSSEFSAIPEDSISLN